MKSHITIEKSESAQAGLSGKDKKLIAKQARNQRLMDRSTMIKEHKTYGDIKVSRRIPNEIAKQVEERDTARDFGRPGHKCKNPGPPHHIIHFQDFLNGEVQGNPHTESNLEAPCRECHKLAHEMNIPSGVSIETFFRERFKT